MYNIYLRNCLVLCSMLISLIILRFALEFLDRNTSYHPQDVSRAANLLLVCVTNSYLLQVFWSNITEVAVFTFKIFLTSCRCDHKVRLKHAQNLLNTFCRLMYTLVSSSRLYIYFLLPMSIFYTKQLKFYFLVAFLNFIPYICFLCL